LKKDFGKKTAPSAKKATVKKPAKKQPPVKKDEERMKCKLCDKKFTRQGLGGHMSRAHPGQSEEYKKKKETRRNREANLNLLRLAQKVYKVRTGQRNVKGTDMNRTKLNKIREEIKQFYKDHPDDDFPLS
jgi:hypothetical protein